MDQLTKRSMLEFVEQENLHLPANNKPLMNLFTNQNWAFPFKDNKVDIFTDGYEFICSLLYNIGKAQHHIHLDTYIFEDDALGYLVADALIDKAEQGVEIRVIYDDVGCWKVKDAFFERMRDAGIDVHAFMPVRFPAFTSKVNYRNHRKLCVIDGKVGFIGGMNIAMRYVKGTGKQTMARYASSHRGWRRLCAAACVPRRLVFRGPHADYQPRLLSSGGYSYQQQLSGPGCDEQSYCSMA